MGPPPAAAASQLALEKVHFRKSYRNTQTGLKIPLSPVPAPYMLPECWKKLFMFFSRYSHVVWGPGRDGTGRRPIFYLVSPYSHFGSSRLTFNKLTCTVWAVPHANRLARSSCGCGGAVSPTHGNLRAQLWKLCVFSLYCLWESINVFPGIERENYFLFK